ncbi:MAG: Rpn family recombination-promoting nuclease/putative transposase [Lachnospiraceae bacterium]|nr:Rpn family recombination-promoting nuclease/putative transposase [Lachnospiraceae bacterium]
MGKNDITLKDYLSEPKRYADLLNGSIFQGRQIIDAGELIEADTVQSKSDEQAIMERLNDITMKQTKDGSLFAVWTVANQQYIDYSMPARVMLQDALSYDRQLKELKRQGYDFADSGEFLSRIRQDDHLHPVITLVIYWGEDEWRGAKSLHDILDFGADPVLAQELKQLVPEYPLHFLNLSEVHNYSHSKTELRTLFELYDRRKDKSAFTQYVEEHDECRHMDAETYWALRILVNTTKLKTMIPHSERTEKNMGNVFDEIWEDAREEGLHEGKLTTLYDLVHDGLLSIKDAAARASMTESAFTTEMQKAGY